MFLVNGVGSAYSSESTGSRSSSMIAGLKKNITDVSNQTLDTFNAEPLWRKIAVFVIGTIFGILGILAIIYREAALGTIVEYSEKWASNPWTPFVLAFLIFCTSFPPLVGFSFLGATTGVVFGVSFNGWLVMLVGSLVGSIGAFLLFRILLKKRAQELISSNDKLYAFSSVLNDGNSYLILALIRVCPFPYSFTNGALAGIPGVSLSHFTVGSLIASPKLFIYLFIGNKIKNMGETQDSFERIIDFLSILLTGLVLVITGWVLFSRTTKRLREIENDRMMEHEYNVNDDDNAIDNEFELDDELDERYIQNTV